MRFFIQAQVVSQAANHNEECFPGSNVVCVKVRYPFQSAIQGEAQEYSFCGRHYKNLINGDTEVIEVWRIKALFKENKKDCL